MKKQKDGYYYEKEVTWENDGGWWALFGGFILSVMILFNNLYLYSLTNIDWNSPGSWSSLSMVFTIFAGVGALITFMALFISDDLAPKRKVKFKRIGK